jgi:CDP-paratose 2-epimerase
MLITQTITEDIGSFAIKKDYLGIGGGVQNSLSLLELFVMLEAKLKIKLNYTHSPVRDSDQLVFIANIEKATSMLDWRPMVSAEDGIDKMISWIKSKY